MVYFKSKGIKNYKQLRKSYDELYRNSPLVESPEHYRWVRKVLSPEKGKVLLDIACGGGHFLKEAQAAGVDVIGLDISIQAIHIARNNAPGAELFCGAGETLPFRDGCFDYAVNLGSLEHFLNPEAGLKEMHRVLKTNGRALLLLPNSYFLMIILNVLRTGSAGRSTDQEIERLATREEWGAMIEEAGLTVESVHKYNYKSPHASWKYRLIRPVIPCNLSYCFLFVCRKS